MLFTLHQTKLTESKHYQAPRTEVLIGVTTTEEGMLDFCSQMEVNLQKLSELHSQRPQIFVDPTVPLTMRQGARFHM